MAMTRSFGAPLTTSLALAAVPVAAETVRCEMEDGSNLSFAIDYAQFSPPVHTKEPPRQQRTIVTHGARQFAATPFLLGDTRGFEATATNGATTVFVVQSGGQARLSQQADGVALTGSCQIAAVQE